MSKNVDRTMLVKAMISKIMDDANPDAIKAKNISDYEMPGKIILDDTGETYIPDIVIRKNDSTSLYEIQLEKPLPVNKWHNLSVYARQKNGNLYLIVPETIKESVKKEIKQNQINAGIIYFTTKKSSNL